MECPFCHNKVTPVNRFSSSTFAMFLMLGIVPFFLNIAGIAIMYFAISPLLQILGAASQLPSLPIPGGEALSAIERFFSRMLASLGVLTVAEVIYGLAVGMIPAVIYWTVRHDTYRCPACGMTLSR
jgi:hypothetical protein